MHRSKFYAERGIPKKIAWYQGRLLCNLVKGSIIRGNSPDLSTEAVHGQRPRSALGLYAYFAAA